MTDDEAELMAMQEAAMQEELDKAAAAMPPDRTHSLNDLRIDALLRIGTTTLPLRNILNIKVGEVVALDRPLSGPVQVIAGGRTVATGDLVAVNGFYAVKIKEVSMLEKHLPADAPAH